MHLCIRDGSNTFIEKCPVFVELDPDRIKHLFDWEMVGFRGDRVKGVV